jgi:chitin synthase
LIYSFCNIDDFSWGTKGCTDSTSKNVHYEAKITFLSYWIISNAFFSYVLILIYSLVSDKSAMVLVIAGYGSFIIFFKFVFALYHHLSFYTFTKFKIWRKMRTRSEKYRLAGKRVVKDLNPENLS